MYTKKDVDKEKHTPYESVHVARTQTKYVLGCTRSALTSEIEHWALSMSVYPQCQYKGILNYFWKGFSVENTHKYDMCTIVVRLNTQRRKDVERKRASASVTRDLELPAVRVRRLSLVHHRPTQTVLSNWDKVKTPKHADPFQFTLASLFVAQQRYECAAGCSESRWRLFFRSFVASPWPKAQEVTLMTRLFAADGFNDCRVTVWTRWRDNRKLS